MPVNAPREKICSLQDLIKLRNHWKREDHRVVFTNGCFDLIHRGHVEYLHEANALGDKLIIGLNSDDSVSRLKGPGRPVKDESSRALILASFYFVDAVIIFGEETPYELIKALVPDVLVKGGDWKPEDIVGSDIVQKAGGVVRSLSFIEGYSSTNLVEKIRAFG